MSNNAVDIVSSQCMHLQSQSHSICAWAPHCDICISCSMCIMRHDWHASAHYNPRIDAIGYVATTDNHFRSHANFCNYPMFKLCVWRFKSRPLGLTSTEWEIIESSFACKFHHELNDIEKMSVFCVWWSFFFYLHTGSDFLWRYPSIDRWSDGNNPSTWLTLIFPIPPSSLNISGFSVCIFSAVGNIVNNNQMHTRLRAWSNRFFHKSIITLNFLPRHSFLCELC